MGKKSGNYLSYIVLGEMIRGSEKEGARRAVRRKDKRQSTCAKASVVEESHKTKVPYRLRAKSTGRRALGS
jgi:hypothetical protein